MEAIAHDALVAMLDRLKLTAIRDQLDSLLDEAARSEMTLREALGFLVSREIARRDERRIEMATKLAQFSLVRELAGFDWSAQPSLDQRPGAMGHVATTGGITAEDVQNLMVHRRAPLRVREPLARADRVAERQRQLLHRPRHPCLRARHPPGAAHHPGQQPAVQRHGRGVRPHPQA